MTDGDRDEEVAHVIDTLSDEGVRDDLSALLTEALAMSLDISADESTSLRGPETAYNLCRDRLPDDRYHELSRTITAAVLTVSPRTVAEVEVGGVGAFLRDRDAPAVETLLDHGVSYCESAHNDGSIEGRCPATAEVVDAVLALYGPGLWAAHFVDADGDAIATRYDGTHQYYWLPESAYARLAERLDADLLDAVVPERGLQQNRERDGNGV